MQFTSALDMQGGGGVNVPLIIFFDFVFLCGTLVYCFEEHMPLPASRGGGLITYSKDTDVWL